MNIKHLVSMVQTSGVIPYIIHYATMLSCGCFSYLGEEILSHSTPINHHKLLLWPSTSPFKYLQKLHEITTNPPRSS